MTLASFPMTSISSKAHKIDFSYFLFTVDATFLYYVQSRNLAEKNLNSRRAGRAGTVRAKEGCVKFIVVLRHSFSSVS